jgi:hypothetical protein
MALPAGAVAGVRTEFSEKADATTDCRARHCRNQGKGAKSLTTDGRHVVFQVGFSSQLVFSSMKAAFDL